jgi:hypothetical protein
MGAFTANSNFQIAIEEFKNPTLASGIYQPFDIRVNFFTANAGQTLPIDFKNRILYTKYFEELFIINPLTESVTDFTGSFTFPDPSSKMYFFIHLLLYN